MPQSDLGAERDIMAAEGASGTSYAPGDSATFPACAEDQVGSPGCTPSVLVLEAWPGLTSNDARPVTTGHFV